MTPGGAQSARLKIGRAKEHFSEVRQLLEEVRPFRCVYCIDARTGERSVKGERDDAAADRLALLCGDVVHALHAALDHAYHSVLAKHLDEMSDREKRSVQFPFASSFEGLRQAVKNRQASRVGAEFEKMLTQLRPCGGPDSNKFLYLIYKLDNPDKHKHLILFENYGNVSSAKLRTIIPDFPNVTIEGGIIGHGGSSWISWPGPRLKIEQWFRLQVPSSGLLKQEIAYPAEVLFEDWSGGEMYPVAETLTKMIKGAEQTIADLERFI